MTRADIKLLLIISFAGMLAACVSSPDDTQPDNISSAEKTQTSGVNRYDAHDYEAAYGLFKKALHQYRTIDNPAGIVTSSINIARTLYASRQIQVASEWVQKAQQLNQLYQPENHLQLDKHISLLTAAIHIENDQIDKAKKQLENVISNKSDSAIKLSALQLRTQIAFNQNQNQLAWLQKYRDAINQNPQSTHHHARAARFSAQLEQDEHKRQSLYGQALNLYRDIAHQPGIASTLYEWADSDIKHNTTNGVENKLTRALYIRLQLKDRHSSSDTLKALQSYYARAGKATHEKNAKYWRKQLNSDNFADWQNIIRDFDGYPGNHPAE